MNQRIISQSPRTLRVRAMALVAAVAAAGALAVVIISAAGIAPADNAVINSDSISGGGVVSAEGGVISTDGVVAPADNGIIEAD